MKGPQGLIMGTMAENDTFSVAVTLYNLKFVRIVGKGYHMS